MARHVSDVSLALSTPTRFYSVLRAKINNSFYIWWQHASSRFELSNITDSDLKDLGYPPQIIVEKNKPFWKLGVKL